MNTISPAIMFSKRGSPPMANNSPCNLKRSMDCVRCEPGVDVSGKVGAAGKEDPLGRVSEGLRNGDFELGVTLLLKAGFDAVRQHDVGAA